MGYDALNAIMGRYSCRAFTDQMPTDGQFDAIARAALAAPSGMNAQPWHVIVAKDRALIADLEAAGLKGLSELPDRSAYDRIMSRGGTLFYGAPAIVMVAMRPDSGLDCGILCENVAIAAEALSLGSVICGLAGIPFAGARGEEFKRRFGFPEGYVFGMSVLIGHPAKPGKPHDLDWSKLSYVG